MHLEVRFLLVS